jgi:hypothetical protein
VSKLKKVASGIGREVRKFWAKIAKVVMHKRRLVAEEVQREEMDRHLRDLVDETERFTAMIAQDFSAKEVRWLFFNRDRDGGGGWWGGGC